jgi:hypothetical protein
MTKTPIKTPKSDALRAMREAEAQKKPKKRKAKKK